MFIISAKNFETASGNFPFVNFHMIHKFITTNIFDNE